MWYSVSCAFNLNHLFDNFPYEKIKFTCKECEAITNKRNRDVLVKRIFKECFKIVIQDIITNNVTFWLPTGSRKSCLKMQRFKDAAFRNLRRSGKWLDVDFLKSDFSGYQIGFFMYGNRTSRNKYVYLNSKYKNQITENTNNGMNYGDSMYDKKTSDYYDVVHSLFPDISITDIKRIINFGWRSYYLHNSYGGDVFIQDKDIWCYTGFLKKDGLRHFYYYIKKTCVKLRVLYKRYKIKWDGYYYFALNNKAYDEYLNQRNKRGRPKKNFKFKNVFLYQILDECKLVESEKKYIFRIPYLATVNFRHYLPELITDKAELIIERNPINFQDILNNEYEFI